MKDVRKIKKKTIILTGRCIYLNKKHGQKKRKWKKKKRKVAEEGGKTKTQYFI